MLTLYFSSGILKYVLLYEGTSMVLNCEVNHRSVLLL